MNSVSHELGVLATLCQSNLAWATNQIQFRFHDDGTYSAYATDTKIGVRVRGYVKTTNWDPHGVYQVDGQKFAQACKLAKQSNKKQPELQYVNIGVGSVSYMDGPSLITIPAEDEGKFPDMTDLFDRVHNEQRYRGKPTLVDPKYLSLAAKIFEPLKIITVSVDRMNEMLRLSGHNEEYKVDVVIMIKSQPKQGV